MKRRKSSAFLVTVILLAAAILTAAALAMLTPEGGNSANGGSSKYEAGKIYSGRLPGCEDYPVNSDPQSFYYLVAQSVVFAKGDAAGNIMLENNPGNSCNMRVTFLLTDDEEEVLYSSPLIKPGEFLYCDTLDKVLDEGVYDVTAKIEALDAEDETVLGTWWDYITFTIRK